MRDYNYPYFYILVIALIGYISSTCKQNSLHFIAWFSSFILWINLTLAHIWKDFNSFKPRQENLILNYALCIFIFGMSKKLVSYDSSTLKDYGTLINTWALRLSLISLIPLTYQEPWRSLIQYDWPHSTSLLFFCILLIAFGLSMSFRSSSLIKPLYFNGSLLYLCPLALQQRKNKDKAVYFQILTNTFLLTSGIFLIARGVKDAISHYFISGICIIMLLAFLRYFDLIGNYIGGAMLFFFFAIVIFLCASFWKKNFTQKES